ncbi:MAG: response regulator, partial [Deltaproteobacteria bacterium]|nr:response regulator [Deltaproteobacteria bacterium]
QRKQSEQERERLQEQNAHLLEAERAARSEAERLGHAKDEFLATLSHELRTPLHAILGWTQLLRRRQHDAKSVDEGMDIIERNAHLQRQLIEDLLDMSRISSGKARLKMQQMCTKDVAEAAVRSVQPAASAKRITVTSRLHPEGLVVRADPGRIQQVLWNLLSNSIKFTPEGGWVEVGEERVGDQHHLYVRDSGRGIDAEFLPHVFERFRQSDASTTRRYGGLGLGLAIVKSLVEMHGGRVSVESDGKDLGSTFHVLLPSSRVEEAHAVSIERTESSTGTLTFRGEPQLLRGVKVLVVDDEEDGRNFVGRIIRECAADVMIASSAREALEIFSTFAPHVLISDIGMPDVDGYELMRRIRALGGDSGGSIPSAALTAFARLEDRTRALMAGYHTHLAKPIDANELVATVASLAGRTGAPV